eukprot:738442-Amphidinium_carterae.1
MHANLEHALVVAMWLKAQYAKKLGSSRTDWDGRSNTNLHFESFLEKSPCIHPRTPLPKASLLNASNLACPAHTSSLDVQQRSTCNSAGDTSPDWSATVLALVGSMCRDSAASS